MKIAAKVANITRANHMFRRVKPLNRELEDFAFVASHDLQEPLRKIETLVSLKQMFKDELGEKGALITLIE